MSDNKLRGGGVIVYVNKDLTFVDMTTENCSNIDYIWMKILRNNEVMLNLGLFYRPPDCSDMQLKFLLRILHKFSADNTIILGDFNFGDINWRNFSSAKNGKLFLKEISSLALVQCVKSPTREKNILDLVLVYDVSLISKIEHIAPVATSDHNTLLVELNITHNKQKKTLTIYKYDQAKYNVLEEKINKIDWFQFMEDRGIEDGWNTLKNILQNFRDNHIPRRVVGSKNFNPWLTEKIKRLIKSRDNLYKRFRRTGLFHFRYRYKKIRNLITKTIRKAKMKYETKIIKRSRNNRKVFLYICCI